MGEGRKFHLVSKRIKVAVRRSEPLAFAAGQIQSSCHRKLSSEQAERGAGVDAGRESHAFIPGFQN